MLETVGLKIASYNFTDKNGKHVETSKLLISLGDFGVYTCCSSAANGLKLLEKCKVKISIDDRNKLVIDSIEK